MAQPPPYGDKGNFGNPGYGPQQYPPPQAGYPPQPQYAPQPVGYAPQPAGYAPQPQMMGQQSSTNVVVVGGQPQQTVIVERQGVNHVLHCIISLFFWPWVIVWIILCITDN
ncbi:uncharacterized protein [Haliotis cracherodii]|uniref:uncharacterized protein n=1 Tax=Haliotis cracherodii TaxID=6455 RepID=UPI0039EA2217